MEEGDLHQLRTGIWPARLLCIEDLTSYRRRDSSDGSAWYGNDQMPRYAILSYTWGRYRDDGRYTFDGVFQRNNNTSTPKLRVFGIDWDIPSIDPERGFTAEQFTRVLRKIAHEANAKYVWVDVACIDQRHDNDNQIGIQASIFRNASMAFIWLHQTEEEDGHPSLEDSMDYAAEAADEAVRRYRTNERKSQAQRQNEIDMVLPLLQDPYFKSLWTLQESFLRPGILLSKTGKTVTIDPGEPWSTWDLNLGSLIDQCAPYVRFTDVDEELHQPIKEAGLDILNARNPMAVLQAAKYRRCSRLQDRIFGIQQIFGVDVGLRDSGGIQSLVFLESKLCYKMNLACPAIAQIFLHKIATPDTACWKAYLGISVSPRTHGAEKTLVVPKEFWDAEPVQNAPMVPHVSWDERYPNELAFDGYSAPFEELWEHWRRTEPLPPPGASSAANGAQFRNRFDCSLYIDKSLYEHNRRATAGPIPLETARQFVEWRRGRVRILILGQVHNASYAKEIEQQSRTAWVGLLISLPPGNGGYDRKGFCTWRASRNSALRNCSRGLHRIGGYDTRDPETDSQDD